jgi:hypothetical protein
MWAGKAVSHQITMGNNQMHASIIVLNRSETRTITFLDRNVFVLALLLATKEGLTETC